MGLSTSPGRAAALAPLEPLRCWGSGNLPHECLSAQPTSHSF